jgi:hypothetical protein
MGWRRAGDGDKLSHNDPQGLGYVPQEDQTVSKCVRVCRLDADGVCIGCKRTIEQITQAGIDKHES